MKKFTLTLLMLCLAFIAYAVPAQRVAHTVKQADGTELTIYLVGDEFFHYYATADNVPLAQAADGSYYYAMVSNDGLIVASNMLAHNKESRSAIEEYIIETNMNAGLMQHIDVTHKVRAIRANVIQRASSTSSAEVLPEGEVNVPVLLVEYADVKFTYTKEDFARMLNEEGYDSPTYYSNVRTLGSARDYFADQSNGKFIPNFVVSDIIAVSQNMEYYGGNDASGNDRRVTYMVREACELLDANYDFSIFDNNKDGEVEFVYCIYAGHNEAISGADPNTIWPHKWYLSAQAGTITLDGVLIDEYACSSECFGLPSIVDANGKPYINGYGALCHEFSHCLGLPDFYDTGSAGCFGMNEFSIMDSGCYNAGGYVPVGYSAYEKNFLGWITIEELTVPDNYTLEPLIDSGKAYKILNDANPTKEYYILENRQKKSWDTYMHADGLMITHVDYDANAWYRNTVNNDPQHQRMTVIPADGKLSTSSLEGDFWPYEGNNALTDTSSPTATVYAGGFMGKPITDIKEENSIITFKFMGGVHVDVPTVQPATDITADGFTANWTSVNGAQKYQVDLYKLKNVGDTGDVEDTYTDPLDELKGASAADYAGTWKFKRWSGDDVYESTATISVVENGTKTYLECKGFACLKASYNYDDKFYLQYDKTTGLVTLAPQYVEKFTYQEQECETVVYLTDSKQSKLFGGSLIGGFKDGKIVFINDENNANIADSFAFIFSHNDSYYLLSNFTGLEWSRSEAAAPSANAPAFSFNENAPQRVMRADAVEEENVLLSEDFAGFVDDGKTIKDKYDSYFAMPGWTGSNVYSESGKMRVGTTVIAGNVQTPELTSNRRVVVSMVVSLCDANDTGVTATFSYIKGDEEVVVATKKIKKAGIINLSFLPEGAFKFKITTKESTGKKRMMISNIVISERMGVSSELIQSIETTDTSYTFSGLETDTEYKYGVMSFDAEGNKSAISDFEFVVLGTVETAIEVVEGDTSLDGIYDLTGRRVDSFEHNGIYIVRKGNSATKILVK